jgi:hypothetical protein
MNKIFLSGSVWREVLLIGAFSCLFALSASAQNSTPASQVVPGSTASTSSTKGIGPAPAHTPQSHLLNDVALSPQTRQTLQEAMNSARASDSAHPAQPAK